MSRQEILQLQQQVARLDAALVHCYGYTIHLKTSGGSGPKTSFEWQIEIEQLVGDRWRVDFPDDCGKPMSFPAPPMKYSKRVTPDRRGQNKPSYTTAAEGKPSRCRGCGMPQGQGHYQGCFDPSCMRLKLPKITIPKPGTANWYKSNGKLMRELEVHEQETAHIRNMRKRNGVSQ